MAENLGYRANGVPRARAVENLLVEAGIEPGDTSLTADKILYHYALEQCQSAALDVRLRTPLSVFDSASSRNPATTFRDDA